MADNWVVYLCGVDGQPASIFVNLGLAQNAPREVHPHMALVRLRMRLPREDGLASRNEFDALVAIEDRLDQELTSQGEAVYVGRNTSAGLREFYFFVSEPEQWNARVAAVMAAFPTYKYGTATRPDAEWKSYFGFLYPSKRELHSIHNLRVCEALKRSGDSLTEPREIDHWAYFPDEETRARFTRLAEDLGFAVRSVSQPDETTDRFGARLYRVDVPSPGNIDSITLPLFDAAAEAGGKYDGWEAWVVR